MTFEDQLQATIRDAIEPLIQEIQELKAKVEGDDGKSLDAKEAKDLLGVSLNRIRELSHDPTFYPALWVSERRVVFSKRLLIKWRDEQQKREAI